MSKVIARKLAEGVLEKGKTIEAIRNHTSNFQYAWITTDEIGDWYGELQKILRDSTPKVNKNV